MVALLTMQLYPLQILLLFLLQLLLQRPLLVQLGEDATRRGGLVDNPAEAEAVVGEEDGGGLEKKGVCHTLQMLVERR